VRAFEHDPAGLSRPAVDARQRLAFARRFGGVDLKRFFAAVPGYPMIAEVRTVPEQRRRPAFSIVPMAGATSASR